MTSPEPKPGLLADLTARFARHVHCRGCGKTLHAENVRAADGCPCNSARGINHGLVPKDTCTCVVCDPEQTGSTRYPPPVDPAPRPEAEVEVETDEDDPVDALIHTARAWNAGKHGRFCNEYLERMADVIDQLRTKLKAAEREADKWLEIAANREIGLDAAKAKLAAAERVVEAARPYAASGVTRDTGALRDAVSAFDATASAVSSGR